MRRSLLDKLARVPQVLLSGPAYVAAGFVLFALIGSLLGLGAYNYLSSSDDISPSASYSQPATSQPSAPTTPAPEISPQPSQTPEPTPVPVLSGDAQMIIEAIGVKAPLITLGLDANAIPEVPLSGDQVTWYNFSAPPGSSSNAVFAAHVTWKQQPAVFWNIANLQEGDTIVIRNGEGREFVYEVFTNFRVNPDDPSSVFVMAPASEPILTLITCGGTWVPNPNEPFGGDYTDRVIVQARLVGTSSV